MFSVVGHLKKFVKFLTDEGIAVTGTSVLKKACSPISITLLGMESSDSKGHLSKALGDMTVTLDGIVIEVRLVQMRHPLLLQH